MRTLVVQRHIVTKAMTHATAQLIQAVLDQSLDAWGEGPRSAAYGHFVRNDVVHVTAVDRPAGDHSRLQRILCTPLYDAMDHYPRRPPTLFREMMVWMEVTKWAAVTMASFASCGAAPCPP